MAYADPNKTGYFGEKTCDVADPSRYDPVGNNQQELNHLREMTSDESIDQIFTYHSPSQGQIPKYQAIREAAKYFAKILWTNVPPGSDRRAALRKLREAVMTANAAIALDGLSLL